MWTLYHAIDTRMICCCTAAKYTRSMCTLSNRASGVAKVESGYMMLDLGELTLRAGFGPMVNIKVDFWPYVMLSKLGDKVKLSYLSWRVSV